MLMTYHDYDDDDVGNHDNNTSYIEHNKLFMSVPTFSPVLYFITMMSLNYMKYCIPSKPSKTSIVETKVQRPQERDHLPNFQEPTFLKGSAFEKEMPTFPDWGWMMLGFQQIRICSDM